MKSIGFLGCIWLLVSSGAIAQNHAFSFEQLFEKNVGCFDSILLHKEDYRLQILYTRIDRDAKNTPHLSTYSFEADKYYYYCASMVKLPAAIIALEKLNELSSYKVSMFDSLVIDSIICHDLNTENLMLGTPFSCIGQYIKEMLLISNNWAFNPLYDFIGLPYFQDRLHEIGCHSAVISHRFAGCDTSENRYCNALSLYDRKSHVLKYTQPCSIYTQRKFYAGKLSTKIGEGYISNAGLINTPKDFQYSNYISLSDLHQLLIKVILPETQEERERWHLTRSDYQYLYKCMGMFPRECAYPILDSVQYPDHYMKYFIGLDSNRTRMPNNLRIFNKVGQAYGFMTDVSYVVDTLNKVEFFLSCSMYLNADGILNDSKYDYDSIGYPFFHSLFNALYAEELLRPKAHLPLLILPDFSDTLIAPIPQHLTPCVIDSNGTAAEMETALCNLVDTFRNSKAEDVFFQNLTIALRQPISLLHSFDRLNKKGVSILTSTDRRLRVFDRRTDSTEMKYALLQFIDSGHTVVVKSITDLHSKIHIKGFHYSQIEPIETHVGKVYLFMGNASNALDSIGSLEAFQFQNGVANPFQLFNLYQQRCSAVFFSSAKNRAKYEYNSKRKVILMTKTVYNGNRAKTMKVKMKFNGQLFQQ